MTSDIVTIGDHGGMGMTTTRGAHEKPEASAELKYEDFKKVQLQVARIMEVERVPGTEKLYRLQIKIGESSRQVVSGLAKHYAPEELKDKLVIIVSNMKPVEMFGVRSDGMLLAAGDGETIRILTVDGEISDGSMVL